MHYDGLLDLSFSQHGYSCKMFTSGRSLNTRLLNWPGISTVGKGGSTKGDGSGMWFLGVKSSCLKTVKASTT